MRFDLKKPCEKCPFRTDVTPYLRKARAAEISHALTEQQATFTCHKHSHSLGYSRKKEEQHCAGAMIVLEKMQRPNQLMRIAERFGEYNFKLLDMKAPVFKTLKQFIKAQEG